MKKAQSGEAHCQYGKRGKDSHNFGKKRTDEEKAKMSIKKIGSHRYYSEDCESFKFFKEGEEPHGWYRKYK